MTTTIEITTASGHEITATLSDDGERVSIYQGGALAGTGRVDYSRGRILDCDARLGAADGSETEDAYAAIEAELPEEQIAHGLTLDAWLHLYGVEPSSEARMDWLAGVTPSPRSHVCRYCGHVVPPEGVHIDDDEPGRCEDTACVC